MSNTPMIAATGDDVVFILSCLGLVVAIMWVIFPFLVLSRFDQLLKIDREIMNGQREIVKTLEWIINGQREIAKALEWMVNNWKHEGSKPPDQQQPPV